MFILILCNTIDNINHPSRQVIYLSENYPIPIG